MTHYRIEKGVYTPDNYYHPFWYSVQFQRKTDYNWETVFRCKTIDYLVECVSKLDDDSTIFVRGYGFNKSNVMDAVRQYLK